MTPRDQLDAWAADEFPHLPYVRYGTSGATLLMDALGQQTRRTIVLPAFICPELPAMAQRAGLRVVHVDMDRNTLHMHPEKLASCLRLEPEQETVLLVDHAFGYPATDIGMWRQRHPGLLIIEDCVRALGSAIDGHPVGHTGDWVLFSMYKTTVGNNHGAILLTRSPLREESAPAVPESVMQWAAGIGSLRALYQMSKRFRTDFGPAPRDAAAVTWSPWSGAPNRLALQRFAHQLEHLAIDREHREAAGREIAEALRDLQALRLVQVADRGRTSSFYLSFTVTPAARRDRLITMLHRQGLFLVWAWNVVPAFYRAFAGTFAYGSAESVFLADHVCHVPLAEYVSSGRRRRLIRALRAVTQD